SAHADERDDAPVSAIVGHIDDAELRAMQLARVVEEPDREAVLRPVDARHGAERSAAKIAVISNLEIAECERDGVHVGAAHAKSPDHEPVERRCADPDAAESDAVQPAARTDAHPAEHEARRVAARPHANAADADSAERSAAAHTDSADRQSRRTSAAPDTDSGNADPGNVPSAADADAADLNAADRSAAAHANSTHGDANAADGDAAQLLSRADANSADRNAAQPMVDADPERARADAVDVSRPGHRNAERQAVHDALGR